MLINASIFSEYDKINGVSANIMLGQLPPCGTGDCEVLLDEDLYIELLGKTERRRRMQRHGLDGIPEIDREDMRDLVPESDPCGYGQIAFNFELPTADVCGPAKSTPKVNVSVA